MHVRGKDSLDEMYTDITADGTVLEKVESFKYLGSIKSKGSQSKNYHGQAENLTAIQYFER